MILKSPHLAVGIVLGGLSLHCSDAEDTAQPFALRFAPVFAGTEVGCADPLSGLGPNNTVSVGMSDLRFYISNLKMYDASGAALDIDVDETEFQYRADAGSVALIDLTSNQTGSCADTAIAFSEGTARTNDLITGTVDGQPVRISFDVGLPQALMKSVITTNTAEDAPSPLSEMYWSWATGYRHLVFNFTVEEDSERGEGYLHIGSRDCGGDGARALSDREACGYVNTPKVELDAFDPNLNTVGIDLGALLAGLDFITFIFDTEPPFDILGEGLGVSCHSSPAQDDCAMIFENIGLDTASGDANPATNAVFHKR